MIDATPDQLELVLRILAETVPECEVRAFGSRAMRTAKHYSDLDLAIVGERALDPGVLRHLREAFEESELPFRVDVLDWHSTSPAFQKAIEGKFVVVRALEERRTGLT